jgi:hypothetical protein
MVYAPTTTEAATMISPYRMLALALSCALGACATNAARMPDDAGITHGSSDGAWQRLDTDGDGALALEELEKQHGVALQEDLWVADSNDDGRVSRQEFDAWWPLTTRVPVPASMARLNASSAR